MTDRLHNHEVACVILAGGQARRMEGALKGNLIVHDRTIMEHIFSKVTGQVTEIALNVYQNIEGYHRYPYPQITDYISGRIGPLAGVLTALSYYKNHRYVLTLPCDTPFLPSDLIMRLYDEIRRGDFEMVCASSNGRLHPTVALWTTQMYTRLEDYVVNQGMRKMMDVQKHFKTSRCEWGYVSLDPFLNINSRSDLKQIEG